jgi:hypothetical protein
MVGVYDDHRTFATMIVVLTNLEEQSVLTDMTVSKPTSTDERPKRQWSASQLAAVVQAAYIREALGR